MSLVRENIFLGRHFTVIQSIIASTAVFNHITKTKRDAAYRDAVSYVTAIDDYNFISEGEDMITSGSTSTITPKLKDSFEGTKPTSGTVTINEATKKVTSAELYFNGFKITYNGVKFIVSTN